MNQGNSSAPERSPFLKEFRYSTLCFVYFCVIIYFQIGLRPSILIAAFNAFSLFLIINLLSKVKYRLIPSIIFVLLISFDAFYAFQYSNYVSLGIAASIFETNSYESKSVLKDIFIPIILVLGITSVLIFKSIAEFKKVRLTIKRTSILLCLYILFIPVFLFVKVFSFSMSFSSVEKFVKEYPVIKTQELLSKRFTLIYGDIITSIAYLNETKNLNIYYTLEREIPRGMSFDKNKAAPENIFLVIGESSSRHHYSLYGYNTPTTPFLNKLSTEGNLKYYNAISPAVTTRQSIPLMLTFITPFPKDRDSFYYNVNLIELANNAGYETLWISNQNRMGAFEGYNTVLARSSAYEYYEASEHKRDDLKLITKVKDRFRKGVKQFFVIHLQGSHISYSDKSDAIDMKALPGSTITDAYNRSIHHTDRVLNDLYEIMKTDETSVMYYISDHGENVGKRGHGFLDEGFSDFDIPMITINNSLIDTDTVFIKYTEPKTGLINSSNTIYILAETIGYKVNQDLADKAVSDGRYIIHTDSSVHLYQ